MKKMMKNIIILLVLAAIAVGGYFAYRQYNKPPKAAEVLETTLSTRGDVANKITDSGNITAGEEISLFINSNQTVKKVYFKAGDMVEAGDVLIDYDIEFDTNDLNRKLVSARLNLKNAELNKKNISLPSDGNDLLQYENDIVTADKNIDDTKNDISSLAVKIEQQQIRLDNAKDTMDRSKTLYDSGAISKYEYDNTVTAYESANKAMEDLLLQKKAKEQTLATRESQKTYAEQKLDNAKNKFSNESNVIKYNLQENVIALNQLDIEQLEDDLSRLTAQTVSPIGGSVSSIIAGDGGTVANGVAVAVISDVSQLKVRAEISEYDAPLVVLGQRVEISTSGLPDKIYNGTVTKIASEAIEKEGSADDEVVVAVEITINDADEKLKIGYSVDVEILTEERNNVVYVPLQAVVNEQGVKYVYVFDGLEVVKKIEVTTGLYGDKTVEIVSGLDEGVDVVTNTSEAVKYLQ